MKSLQVGAIGLAVTVAGAWVQFAADILLRHSGAVSTTEVFWRGLEAVVGGVIVIWFLRTFPFFGGRE